MSFKKRYFISTILSFFFIFFIACYRDKTPIKQNKKEDILVSNCQEWVFLCGERIDTLIYYKNTVNVGQGFKDIIKPYSLGGSDISNLKAKTKDFVDFSKISVGDLYYIAHIGDEKKTIKLLVLKKTPTEFIICKFSKDSICSSIYKKPISIKERSIAIQIENQFQDTKKIHKTLYNLIVDIYKDKFDLKKLRKGDRFKVIYNEKMVESESLGIDNIKGIEFIRDKKSYYAIPYMAPDDTANFAYYNEKGHNLNKFFLKSPLKEGRIASAFNMNRFHPVLKMIKAHLGTDFAAPIGTPILSTAKGVVIEAGYKINNGNYVKIKHNNTYTTQYLHMSKIGKGIKPNTKVKQGQVIGFVGSTGLATGPHVCYRFWKNGVQVNPFKEKKEIPNQIEDRYFRDYLEVFNDIKYKLDQIQFVDPLVKD